MTCAATTTEGAGSDVFANLACEHDLFLFHSDDAVNDVLISEERAPRRKDGWFAAPKCAVCGRRRRVTSVTIRASMWTLKGMTLYRVDDPAILEPAL